MKGHDSSPNAHYRSTMMTVAPFTLSTNNENMILATTAICILLVAIHLRMYRARKHHFDRTTEHKAWWRMINSQMFEMYTTSASFATGFRTSKHILLSDAEVQDRLTARVESVQVERDGNPVMRVDGNVVASNNPCEDFWALDVVSRRMLSNIASKADVKSFWQSWTEEKLKVNTERKIDGDEGGDDFVMITVLDGHCGGTIAQIVKQTLHACLSNALAKIQEEEIGELEMQRVIKETYIALDKDLTRATYNLLSNESRSSEATILPSPLPSQIILSQLEHAGACAITALVDVRARKLYTANAGDCRAVAIWHNAKTGVWRCDTLSSDMSSENPQEADRIRAEHPESEASDVVADDGTGWRVLGCLAPSRGFGDSDLKNKAEENEAMSDAFGIKYIKTQAPNLTPPYMTAEPDITVRDIHGQGDEVLRFVVLGTDGLWDSLSSEEVALLAAAHATLRETSVAKADLAKMIAFSSQETARPYPVADLPGSTASNSNGVWQFRDSDIATHLIRNTVARGDPEMFQIYMSMDGGVSRWFRDDITCVVMSFGE